MNFLSKLLLPKVAGPLAAFMLAVLMVLSVSVYTKSQRIEALAAQLEACVDEKQLIMDAATTYRAANLQKDEVIRKQTASIKALKEKSDVAQAAYEQRLEAGRLAAAEYRAEAANLLKLDAGTTDELDLCRAARELLEKELIND